MAKKLISYDDEATGLGLPDVVAGRLDTRFALKGDVPTGVVTSQQVTRILTSMNPDTPLEEGDLLLVYAPYPSWVENFTTDLSPWTQRWVPGDWSIVDDPTATDGKAVQVTGTAGRRALTHNAFGDLGESDVEILTRAKTSSVGAGILSNGAAARVSGAAGAENGYIAVVSNLGLTIAKYVDGAYNKIYESSAFIPNPNEWYWLRFRLEGKTLKAKAWADGSTEPTAWTISTQDTSISSSGGAGIFASGGHPHSWDVVAISTHGETAKVAE